jgi:hypothetical protein
MHATYASEHPEKPLAEFYARIRDVPASFGFLK